MNRTNTFLTLAAVTLILAPRVAVGQEAADPLDEIRSLIVGEYRGEEHRLHIVQVESPPFEKPIYVELVRHGFEETPDRQQLWWFYERDGQVYARVNQFPPRIDATFATNLADLAVGTWGAPQFYPQLNSDQYDALGDMTVEVTDGSVTLRSQYPFAIAFGGATHAEAEVSFSQNGVEWQEIGRDAAGQIVWPAEDAVRPIVMERQSESPRARRLDSGVVIVDLREGLSTDVQGMDQVEPNDSVAAHYTGWLATGMMIDSSRLPGRQPFIGQLPAPIFPGFNDALVGMRGTNFAGELPPFSSTVRRAFIPPSRAFGAQGNPPIIPPNASLIFNFEIQSIKADVLNSPGEARPPSGPEQQR